ncbi:hypothetical protein Ciccas_000438 [Cichlidogyrus casuarinus]|uniref:Uncharacterized protein n=1 Tax=Cichlidogyrus casuarinus TaxID=1844966 RepID=A0ABD2QMW0_9PLAT
MSGKRKQKQDDSSWTVMHCSGSIPNFNYLKQIKRKLSESLFQHSSRRFSVQEKTGPFPKTESSSVEAGLADNGASVFSLPAVSPSLWQIEAPVYVVSGTQFREATDAAEVQNLLRQSYGKSSILALHAIPPPRLACSSRGRHKASAMRSDSNSRSAGHILLSPSPAPIDSTDSVVIN